MARLKKSSSPKRFKFMCLKVRILLGDESFLVISDQSDLN